MSIGQAISRAGALYLTRWMRTTSEPVSEVRAE